MKQLCRLLFHQSVMDFRKRYFGTLLGGVWAIVSPLITIGLIYGVFTFGLKTGVMGNVSFINWLVPGMLAWFFMSEAIAAGCTAIVESSHLVTKVVFPVEILPLSKVAACMPVHLCLMSCFLLLLVCEGSGAIHTWLQLPYYFVCAAALCSALAFIVSACTVFVRDTVNVVGVCLQFFFWATPIFWDPAMIASSRFHWLLLSPFNYVLQGYRDSLFSGVWFWSKPLSACVFWVTTLGLACFARRLFTRSRPHFADVL
jgi:ABC-type polysaccharide/polyol phosphate export permease